MKINQLRIGDQLLVETFAGPEVTMQVTHVDAHRGWAEGCLVYRQDLADLKGAGVPYEKDDVPKKCTGVIFEFQIIRKIRKKRRKKNG